MMEILALETTVNASDTEAKEGRRYSVLLEVSREVEGRGFGVSPLDYFSHERGGKIFLKLRVRGDKSSLRGFEQLLSCFVEEELGKDTWRAR